MRVLGQPWQVVPAVGVWSPQVLAARQAQPGPLRSAQRVPLLTVRRPCSVPVSEQGACAVGWQGGATGALGPVGVALTARLALRVLAQVVRWPPGLAWAAGRACLPWLSRLLRHSLWPTLPRFAGADRRVARGGLTALRNPVRPAWGSRVMRPLVPLSPVPFLTAPAGQVEGGCWVGAGPTGLSCRV